MPRSPEDARVAAASFARRFAEVRRSLEGGDADEATRRERAGARGHAALDERTSRQLTQEEKAARATYTVANSGTLEELGSEQEVREVVKGLNRRIVEWRRIPSGPPMFLRLVDEDAMVTRWRDAHRTPPSPAPAAPAAEDPAGRRRHWWRRRGR